MPSSPKNLNYGFTPKLFRLFSSMVQNHWYILQHKSPKLTVYKALRQIFKIKSPLYHIILPSDSWLPLLEWMLAFPFISCSFDLYCFVPSNPRFQADIFRTHSQTSLIPWICSYFQPIIFPSNNLIPLSSGSATCALAGMIPCRSISSIYHS